VRAKPRIFRSWWPVLGFRKSARTEDEGAGVQIRDNGNSTCGSPIVNVIAGGSVRLVTLEMIRFSKVGTGGSLVYLLWTGLQIHEGGRILRLCALV